MHPDFFAQPWAAAWAETINASPAYRTAAARWEGDVVLRLVADAARGVPEPRAVYLDLWHGECREARVATAEDEANAAFLLEADPATWLALLEGELSPVMALFSGRLRLARGNIAALLPYADAARELVVSAGEVQRRFPARSP